VIHVQHPIEVVAGGTRAEYLAPIADPFREHFRGKDREVQVGVKS